MGQIHLILLCVMAGEVVVASLVRAQVPKEFGVSERV